MVLLQSTQTSNKELEGRKWKHIHAGFEFNTFPDEITEQQYHETEKKID